jgi:ribosome-associated protein
MQASNIVLLDVREACSFANYFVICSGDSDRQLNAIAEEIAHKLKKSGERPLQKEGDPDSGWMLYDYGDVVVHIFAPDKRAFYGLDELWSKAVPVLRVQ